MSRSRIAENPFYVLELRPDATAAEIERAGQKLLAMLEIGLEAAASYPTPLGGMPRDPDQVRRAVDELRDPERRIVHELWATLQPDIEATLQLVPGAHGERTEPDPWPGAMAALGWGRRR
ncbi:MAG TPA: hypothetical protein ENK18_00445 [Deltaproteobacteria bacterium]|nr:hypothetical protein [Deltaproteobacteria bacterium]